jgi:HicB family
MSEAALEISGQLTDGHVAARLDGSDVSFSYVADPSASEVPADGDDLTARITLRVPESLKSRVEAAAQRDNTSVNSWLVRAVSDQLGRRTFGNRITGSARD